jgi:glycosyltransferase involved in cell wall biosynthesis
MNSPLVSVLIPSYNHSKYVIETLNSVLIDSYPNKEIIIIDDGSKDNSVDIIQKWVDENSIKIKVHFLHRNNKGLCNTLNELIELSNGKYLQLLASDDKLISGKLFKRVEILEANESEKKFCLVADAEVIDKDSKTLHKSYIVSNFGESLIKKIEKLDINKLLSSIYFICAPTVLINKRIYQEIGLYNTKLLMEDKFFYIEASILNFLLFHNKSVVAYRIHDSNTCGLHVGIAKKKALNYSEIIGFLDLFKKYRKVFFIYYLFYHCLRHIKYSVLLVANRINLCSINSDK